MMHNLSQPASSIPEPIAILDEIVHTSGFGDDVGSSLPALFKTCGATVPIQGLSLSEYKYEGVYIQMVQIEDPTAPCTAFALRTVAILWNPCVRLASPTATEWWVCSFTELKI